MASWQKLVRGRWLNLIIFTYANIKCSCGIASWFAVLNVLFSFAAVLKSFVVFRYSAVHKTCPECALGWSLTCLQPCANAFVHGLTLWNFCAQALYTEDLLMCIATTAFDFDLLYVWSNAYCKLPSHYFRKVFETGLPVLCLESSFKIV